MAAAREGAKVAVIDLYPDKAQETLGRIQQEGGEGMALAADLSKHVDAHQAVLQIVAAWKGIHYLCNSAGLQTYGTVESTDEDTWDKTLDVNLKSIYLLSKYCIPEIRKQGGGAVVNISSVQGLQCQRNVVAYAASKGGAIALSRAMAMDHARENIRVNCICPGSVDTPMLRYGAAQHGPMEEVLKEWGENHAIGRIGRAEEVAQTVLFLWSDAAGFMLGYPVVVDGGLISGLL